MRPYLKWVRAGPAWETTLGEAQFITIFSAPTRLSPSPPMEERAKNKELLPPGRALKPKGTEWLDSHCSRLEGKMPPSMADETPATIVLLGFLDFSDTLLSV